MARILIADDSRPIRMLLHRALSLDGHAVLEAADGDAALACLIDERPDVAILDVIMPGLSGIDVCRAARADPRLDEIGLIFLTGDASSEQVRTAGADFTFTKPFSPHALLAAIAEIAPPAEPDGAETPSETRSRLLARRRRSRAFAVR
jgi:two-component system response regulator MtrA